MASVNRIDQAGGSPALRTERIRHNRFAGQLVTAFVQPVLLSTEILSSTTVLLTFAAAIADFPGLTHTSAYRLVRDSDSMIFPVLSVAFNLTFTEITLTTAARTTESYTLVLEW